MTTQGIGVRMPRKEDARHLHGRGNFVSDMILPGRARSRSCAARWRTGACAASSSRPAARTRCSPARTWSKPQAIVAPDHGAGLQALRAAPARPRQGALRRRGDRHVRRADARRGRGPHRADRLELDELPVLVDAHAARAEPRCASTRNGPTTSFLTLNFESGFDAKAQGRRPSWCVREVALSRQAMVPMEGKVVLAYWDDRTDQLIVYASTQVPHVIRIGLAQFLGLDQGKVRVVSPDVGGGFGYKFVVQPEELCVAWLALKFRKPFRYIEDRREHLVVGANARQHHYSLTGYADERGRLLALDAEVTSTAAPIRCGRSRSRSSRARRPATCRARTISAAIAARPTASPPTSRASCPIAGSRAPASASPWS